jgi:hypothetical protein
MENWIKSSYCAADKPQCVEVALTAAGVQVRDSKSPVATLRFTVDEWTAFLAGVKAGEFDLS